MPYPYVAICSLLVFETGAHVAQSGLELLLLSSGTIGTCHYTPVSPAYLQTSKQHTVPAGQK